MRESYLLQRTGQGWMFSYYKPTDRGGKSFDILVNELDNKMILKVDGAPFGIRPYTETDSLEALFEVVNRFNNNDYFKRER